MVKTGAVDTVNTQSRIWLAAGFCLALLGLHIDAAQAGVLYRCADQDGVTVYASGTAGYRNCKLVGNFAPEKSTAPAPAAAAKPSPAAVEFRTAPGEGEPKAVPEVTGTQPQVTRGAVYKYERNGVTHYTNRRPSGQRAQVLFTYIETCFACSTAPGLDFNSVGLNLDAYRTEIAAAATLHGVDEALIRAIIHAESAFNPNAISHVGAQGLMQLMPDTATRFGVTSAFEPSQNIDGGTRYLAWLSGRFNGDLSRIAAGYNAGEGAVDRFDGVPPYQETQLFVERVGILRERYRKELAERNATPVVQTVAGGA